MMEFKYVVLIAGFRKRISSGLLILIMCDAMFWANPLLAQQVPVRHGEGLIHGFLVLRTLQGETLADGDLIQNVHGDRVTSRLLFHFKDGSLHDDTAIFSQHGSFRLLSEHLIQKGPACLSGVSR